MPEPIKAAAKAGHRRRQNGYTVTPGHPRAARPSSWPIVRKQLSRARTASVLVTSGTSGGLVLALLVHGQPRRRGHRLRSVLRHVSALHHAGRRQDGAHRHLSRFPHRRRPRSRPPSRRGPRRSSSTARQSDRRRLRRETLRDLAELADERNILLISDEVYRAFCYDGPFASPAEFNDDALVIDGFSKAYGMTGWRLGFCHGPRRLIEEMIKLQQFTFVCAPSIVQYAGRGGLGLRRHRPSSPTIKQKRDRLGRPGSRTVRVRRCRAGRSTCSRRPRGARAASSSPRRSSNNLLIIPGSTFSQRDTHFRISYAASDETIDRGIDILNRMARRA